MTNKQYLIAEIKKMLERDGLADHHRVRLLGLLAKHLPKAPRPKKAAAAKAAKARSVHKAAPFQRPATASPARADWLDSEVAQRQVK